MNQRRNFSRQHRAFWAFLLLCLAVGFGGIARAQDETMPLPKETGAVVVGDRVILTLRTRVGSISPSERAAIVNTRIKRILSDPNLPPDKVALQTETDNSDALLIRLSEFTILSVTDADARVEGTSPELLAQTWLSLIRSALIDVKPLYKAGETAHKEAFSFVPLLLVAALAFLVPLIAARFKKFPIPVVVGEILIGVVIGKSGLNLVGYDSTLQFLAEFGFAYLMFLAGMEVDIDLLRTPKNGKNGNGAFAQKPPTNPVLLAVVILGLTFVLALLVAVCLTQAGFITQPWLMSLVLSTTSLGLIVPVLKERKLTTTPFGQALLMTALIADFVTMFLITIVAGWLSQGLTFKLFLGLLLIGVFVMALRMGRWFFGIAQVQETFEQLRHTTSQVAVRGSLALMLAFVAISESLGTEVILGAFLAGVLLALLNPRDDSTGELREKLEALGFGFFIPIFFILVGVRFDLLALVASPQGMALAPLLIVSAFLIKIIASLPFRAVAPWRDTFAAGFLMSSRLSLIIAAAEIGLRLGLFGQTIHSAIICVALVTCVGGPLGFNLLAPAPAKKEPVAKAKPTEELPQSQ